MDRVITIFFNDKSYVNIPEMFFSLNDIAEYIIDCGIYKPGHIVDIKMSTINKDNTVYMEEK